MLEESLLDEQMEMLLPRMGIDLPASRWPVVIKEGRNDFGDTVRYIMNYSGECRCIFLDQDMKEMLSERNYIAGNAVEVGAWEVAILKGDYPDLPIKGSE